jgi:hypothetical protein
MHLDTAPWGAACKAARLLSAQPPDGGKDLGANSAVSMASLGLTLTL